MAVITSPNQSYPALTLFNKREKQKRVGIKTNEISLEDKLLSLRSHLTNVSDTFFHPFIHLLI